MSLFAKSDPKIAFLALVHDAHEAYCGDMVSPQKAAMIALDQGEGAYSMIERFAQNAVEHVMGIDMLWTPGLRAKVKELDTRICIDERQSLKILTSNDWGLSDLNPLGISQQISNFGWRDLESVEKMWLSLYFSLKS